MTLIKEGLWKWTSGRGGTNETITPRGPSVSDVGEEPSSTVRTSRNWEDHQKILPEKSAIGVAFHRRGPCFLKAQLPEIGKKGKPSGGSAAGCGKEKVFGKRGSRGPFGVIM